MVKPEESEKLREQVRKLERELEQARKQIGQQEKDIQKLEKELAEARQNSTNSSKPPSSDGPTDWRGPSGSEAKKVAPTKPRANASLEGKQDIQDTIGSWWSAEAETVVVAPVECSGCGVKFSSEATGNQRIGEPSRHQVASFEKLPTWQTSSASTRTGSFASSRKKA